MFTLGARVRLSLRPNVNTPFFQVPTPEFWHRARVQVQGFLATLCLNIIPFGAGAQALVLMPEYDYR